MISLAFGINVQGDAALQSLKAEIEAKIQEVSDQVAAGHIQDRLDYFTNATSHIDAAFDNLPATLALHLSSGDVNNEITNSATPDLETLWNWDSSWHATFDSWLYFSDPFVDAWQGNPDLVPQQSADHRVFNYMYALPVYLKAILELMTVILTLDRDHLQLYADSLRKFAKRLVSDDSNVPNVYDTILNGGIANVRIPSQGELTPITSVDNQYLVPIGAVERYSGFNSFFSYEGPWPPSELSSPSGSFPFDGSDENQWLWGYLAKLKLRALWCKKRSFVGVGLGEVLKAANHVYRLIGDSQVQRPDISNWSMAEVAQVVGWNGYYPYPLGSLRGLLYWVSHMPYAGDSIAWPGLYDYWKIRDIGIDKLPDSFRGSIEYYPEESHMVEQVASGM